MGWDGEEVNKCQCLMFQEHDFLLSHSHLLISFPLAFCIRIFTAPRKDRLIHEFFAS
jgi:hypothetical protein